MPKSKPKKITQTEKAYEALKRAIIQSDIEEGKFVSETDVMERYGIGRTPFREACNRLHHEGLLQVMPHHGYLVPEMSFHAVCELFEVRLILEDAISQLATLRATDQEIDDLERLASQQILTDKSKAMFSAFIEANGVFHLALAKITRNRRLLDLLKQNLESTERLMYIELRSSGFRDAVFRSLHQRIVDALRKRDPDAVRQAVWDDITDGQRATTSFSKMRFPGGLLAQIEDSSGMAPPARRARASAKTKEKN